MILYSISVTCSTLQAALWQSMPKCCFFSFFVVAKLTVLYLCFCNSVVVLPIFPVIIICCIVLSMCICCLQVIGDKHEDVMAKFGAVLAQGIIDASGRNVTVSLQSRSGHTNMAAVVGLLVFNQFWYYCFMTCFIHL